MQAVGVGIIGLSASGGWAATAHVPALRAVPGYEIRALSASSRQSAEDAAREHDVPLACGSAEELALRPEVDLVVVSVKVPHHRELVLAAVEAGKDVLCEWPLGNGLAEAEELAAAAEAKGVRGFVGLQGRSSPGVRHVRELVRSGAIGEVLSTTLVGVAGSWGATVAPRSLYLLDRANGATMLTIPFSHSVDALCACLGEFRELTAMLATRRPTVRREDTGETVPMTAYDQAAVTGILESGAVASIHYRGGRSHGAALRWEISGTDGEIFATGNEGHLQRARVDVQVSSGADGRVVDSPVAAGHELVPGEPGSAPYTVAQAYAHLLGDLRNGTHEVPTFADAVIRHRMIDAIERAGTTGQRQSYLG